MSANQKKFYISVLNAKPYRTSGIAQHFVFIYKFIDNKPVVSGDEYTTFTVNTPKLSAKLKDINGNLLKGKTIKFYGDGKYIGSNVTNSKGIAIMHYSKLNKYSNITAVFNGDSVYYGSSDSELIKIKSKLTLDVVASKVKYNYYYKYVDRYVNGYYVRYYTGYNIGKYTIGQVDFCLNLNKWIKHGYYVNSYGDMNIVSRMSANQKKFYISVFNAKPYNASGKLQHFIFVYKFIDNKPVVSGDEYTSFTVNTHRLTGKLKDVYGNPLKGKTIKFYGDGKYIGSSVTNSKGIAIKYYYSTKQYSYFTAKFVGDSLYYGCEDLYNS
jgi:hypothetical protein